MSLTNALQSHSHMTNCGGNRTAGSELIAVSFGFNSYMLLYYFCFYRFQLQALIQSEQIKSFDSSTDLFSPAVLEKGSLMIRLLA
jgi:hypothetical protein